jgi:hypothetical protein
MTCQFEELKVGIVHPNPKQHPHNEWIYAETWQLVTHLMVLRWTGQLCRAGSRRLKRDIWAPLRDDRITKTKQVGKCIEAKLAGGGVQEACWHLKGWYCATTEVKAWPCFQTMERQMAE